MFAERFDWVRYIEVVTLPVVDALSESSPGSAPRWNVALEDLLASMACPREHRTQRASTNPLERVDRAIKRRCDVIGISSIDNIIVRLVGALTPETNHEWAVGRRYTSLETLSRVTDNPTGSLPAVDT